LLKIIKYQHTNDEIKIKNIKIIPYNLFHLYGSSGGSYSNKIGVTDTTIAYFLRRPAEERIKNIQL